MEVRQDFGVCHRSLTSLNCDHSWLFVKTCTIRRLIIGLTARFCVTSNFHACYKWEVNQGSSFARSLYTSAPVNMPLEEDDQKRVDQAKEDVGADDSGTRLLVLNATQAQKLGFWTVVCTVLNRAVGARL